MTVPSCCRRLLLKYQGDRKQIRRTGSRLLVISVMAAIVASCSTNAATEPRGSQSVKTVYPTRHIELIYPYGVGSPGDLIARKLAPAMSVFLRGQLIQVVDVPGAVGTIGTSQLVGSAPNGYTIELSPQAPLVFEPYLIKTSYTSPATSYTTLADVAYSHDVLVVSASSPWKDLSEFIAYAKRSPVPVSVSTTGSGGVYDLASRQLAALAGFRVDDVPFTGTPLQVSAVLGGHTTAAVTGITDALPYIAAGKLRALAVFARHAQADLKGVPTVGALGYRVASSVDGVNLWLIAPSHLPNGVTVALDSALSRSLAKASIKSFLAKAGWTEAYAASATASRILTSEYNSTPKLFSLIGGSTHQ